MKVWNVQGTVEEKYVIHVSSQSTNEKKLNKTKVACKSQYLLLSPLVAITADIRFGRDAIVLSMTSIGILQIVSITRSRNSSYVPFSMWHGTPLQWCSSPLPLTHYNPYSYGLTSFTLYCIGLVRLGTLLVKTWFHKQIYACMLQGNIFLIFPLYLVGMYFSPGSEVKISP